MLWWSFVLRCAVVAGEKPKAPNWWEISSLDNARSLALFFDRESRRHFIYREGHITSSEKALGMYFEVARGPLVKNICDVGFNAGHSAAVFLNANPQADVYSFDLGQFPYTLSNARLMSELFPERFNIIWGTSQTSVVEFAEIIEKDFRCDVISVDGDHTTEGTYKDLQNFQKLASCRNWVLMDDAGWSSTNAAWQKAKDDGIITQLECFVDLSPKPDFQFLDFPENRSWCIGMFNVDRDDCPKWFDASPNSNVTRVRVIDL